MINPVAAKRKIERDGVTETLKTGTWKLRSKYLLPICRKWIKSMEYYTRKEVRNRAVMTEETETEFVAYKGASGLPSAYPQAYYPPGERFVSIFNNAKILGRKGLVVDRDGKVIPEATTIPPIYPRREALALEASISLNGLRDTFRPIHNEKADYRFTHPVCPILPPFSNYYHGLIEHLMKLRMLEKFGIESREVPQILIPQDCPDWFYEVVLRSDYYGNVVRWGDETAIAERLVIPTFPDPVIEDIRWMKNQMVSSPTENPDGRLLITREDSTNRQIDNLGTVVDGLEEVGFESFCPGEHSVKKQAEMFNNAEMVVGVHGAGLSNIIFCNEDATLIELAGSKELASFSRLCEIKGMGYERVESEKVQGDLVVDDTRLKETVGGYE